MFVKMESDVFFGGADSEVEAKLPSCHPFKVHKRKLTAVKTQGVESKSSLCLLN